MNRIANDEVLRRIRNLPSLPLVVMELLQSIDQEDVRVDTLAEKIQMDQSLTAKTLRLANSSFYGMAKQVNTVDDAIAILGFRIVRSLASTAALIGMFGGPGKGGFDATPFWRHSIAAALCARELARHAHIDPEHAYTAGLLHDIGRLVLATQFAQEYAATMEYRSARDCQLLEAERATLGTDHAAVGLLLTEHWNFPGPIHDAVASHHGHQVSTMSPIARITMAADAISHALDLDRDASEEVPDLPDGLWAALGLGDERLLQVFAKVEHDFGMASLFTDSLEGSA